MHEVERCSMIGSKERLELGSRPSRSGDARSTTIDCNLQAIRIFVTCCVEP